MFILLFSSIHLYLLPVILNILLLPIHKNQFITLVDCLKGFCRDWFVSQIVFFMNIGLI